ncbi:MAG: DMT family transporter [Ignavibacteriales bacterium]|nr:DMT family transporter [Ignavibacteriales bacterium]
MEIFAGVALFVTLLLWASAFAGIRVALHGYSPIELAAFRYIVASAAFGLFALIRGARIPERKDLLRLTIIGGLGIAVYNIALNYGEISVSAGAASFIVSTIPVFTTVFSISFLRENVKLLHWFGMAIALAGVGIIALGGGGLRFDSGALLILVAAVSSSLYNVLQKPLLAKYGALNVVSYAMWIGTILLLPFASNLPKIVKNASTSETLAVIYMGIFPAAIAQLCWSYVLARTQVSRISIAIFLVPLMTIVIAFFWIGEIPTLFTVVGGAICLGGVALSTLSGRK